MRFSPPLFCSRVKRERATGQLRPSASLPLSLSPPTRLHSSTAWCSLPVVHPLSSIGSPSSSYGSASSPSPSPSRPMHHTIFPASSSHISGNACTRSYHPLGLDPGRKLFSTMAATTQLVNPRQCVILLVLKQPRSSLSSPLLPSSLVSSVCPAPCLCCLTGSECGWRWTRRSRLGGRVVGHRGVCLCLCLYLCLNPKLSLVYAMSMSMSVSICH